MCTACLAGQDQAVHVMVVAMMAAIAAGGCLDGFHNGEVRLKPIFPVG